MESKSEPSPRSFLLKQESAGIESGAGFFSLITYSYLNQLFTLGSKSALQDSDLSDLHKSNGAKSLESLFETSWLKFKNRSDIKRNEWKLIFAILSLDCFGWDFFKGGFYLLLYNLITIIAPILLRFLLIWLQNNSSSAVAGNSSIWYPLMLVFILFFSSILNLIFYNQQFELGAKTGFRTRTALSQTLFKKFFKLSNGSKEKYSIGSIVNLSSTDVFKIDVSFHYFHMVWAGVVLIIATFVVLFVYMGIAVISGAFVILAYLPIQYYFSNINAQCRKEAHVFTDQRMKIIQESVKGIRVIKSYNWEESFLNMISDLRKEETKLIFKYLVARSATSSITQVVPTFALIVTLIVYSVMGNTLSIATVIPSLALFASLRVPLLFVPVAISLTIEAWIGYGRISNFLLCEELAYNPLMLKEASSDILAIKVENCCFEWHGGSAALMDIDLRIPKGQLVAIVGPIGAGKSSLVQALLGEMKKRSGGDVLVNGVIGYTEQLAWLGNATLQENILFGLPLDKKRLNSVIKDCCLERDISILPGGLEQEIGEEGINLSGGQKQRISLARACYRDPDIFLFDDPLSAVDAEVGRNLFENLIKKRLSGKTRVLITHQQHFLDQCDHIIFMKDCRILCQGSYQTLVKTSKEFRFIYELSANLGDEKKLSVSKTPIVAEKLEVQTPLMQVEDRETGMVKFFVYRNYLLLAGGLTTLSILIFTLFLVHGTRVLTDQWLFLWTVDKFSLSRDSYIGIFVSLAIAQVVFALFFGFQTSHYGSKASFSLHDQALRKIYRCPTSFFDQTPLGRITSRFSRDCDTLDSLLPEAFRAFLFTGFMCFTNVILICIYLPAFLVPVAIAAVLYYYLQKRYRVVAIELRRIDSITRSPIIAILSETLGGISSIRAYNGIGRYIENNARILDGNNRAQYLVILTQRWIQLRIEVLNSILVLMTALLAVLFRDLISPGISGILITYAVQITQTFSWTMKTGIEVESYLNSAERLLYYAKNIDSEAEMVIEDNAVPKNWPHEGRIYFKDVSMRYRRNLPLVLDSVSFEIKPTEKIGIVGRTGAGKSSILSAMLRLVEYECGSIIIDDIAIEKIGLSDLRRNLTIIPQDPVLFSGTFRFNIDPFGNFSDDVLWDVLKRSALYKTISGFPLKLETIISEEGSNLSVGQRQLVCLARAMLRKSKVILLDEATASVDFETDQVIQKSIRLDFSDSTIITIAHRLNTIADYDKVVVMSDGKISEFGAPVNLLENPNSLFLQMVLETGSENTEIITKIAKGHYAA